jgi:hypothetical protein
MYLLLYLKYLLLLFIITFVAAFNYVSGWMCWDDAQLLFHIHVISVIRMTFSSQTHRPNLTGGVPATIDTRGALCTRFWPRILGLWMTPILGNVPLFVDTHLGRGSEALVSANKQTIKTLVVLFVKVRLSVYRAVDLWLSLYFDCFLDCGFCVTRY